MTQDLPFDDDSVDLVHARCISTSVRSYDALLAEVARVLRPGGLFLAGEFARRVDFAPHLAAPAAHTIETHAPGLHALFTHITLALARRRPSISCAIAPRLAAAVAGTNRFGAVEEQVFCMPVGPWPSDGDADVWLNFSGGGHLLRTIGYWYRATLDRYANSMGPMLRDAGKTQPEIDGFVREWRHDLGTVHGMVTQFHLVYGRKV